MGSFRAHFHHIRMISWYLYKFCLIRASLQNRKHEMVLCNNEDLYSTTFAFPCTKTCNFGDIYWEVTERNVDLIIMS